MASFVPRYYEIEQELRARIANLSPGDPVPSDAQLVAEFGVSRMTARSAMQRLVHEGLVLRERGRGTFVARPRVGRQLDRLRSFTQEMRVRDAVASSQVLLARVRTGTVEELHTLALDDGSDVVELRRLRLADDVPLAVEHAILSIRCQAVLQRDLARSSLHQALREIGIVPTGGSSTVTAELAHAGDVRVLEIPRVSALLVERRIIHDADGVPFEATESRYVPDRFVLQTAFDVVPGDGVGPPPRRLSQGGTG